MLPFRHFLLFLLCLTKSSTAIAGDQSTGFDIHCNLFYGSLILAPVMVNGFGPYDFVLDTGTSATIIDSKLAAQLSLPWVGRTTQFAVQDSSQVPIARVNVLGLGGATVPNLAVLVESIAGVDQFEAKIRGVLGEDFLSRFDFLLDNRHHQLHLEEGVVAHSLVEDLEGEHIPLLDHGRAAGNPTSNRLLLSAKVPDVGPNELTFALDSGASTIVLFSNAHTRAWLLPRQDSGTSAMSRSLSANARSIELHRLRTLTLGKKIFADLAAAVPASAPAQDSDGLLPTGIFQSVYISHSGRFAIFDPVVRNTRNTVRKR
jgi:gag-polyprotein putative aspartyl protease/Aspartyl protease